jgi:hypothetical protein
MRSYEADYAGWAEDMAHAICDGRWSEIDRQHLAEEVAALAGAERREIRSRFQVLFLHLLKKRYQPGMVSRSWEASMDEQRIQLRDVLEENPSLATDDRVREAMGKAYRVARHSAVRETGLPLETFPVELPFSDEEIWGSNS